MYYILGFPSVIMEWKTICSNDGQRLIYGQVIIDKRLVFASRKDGICWRVTWRLLFLNLKSTVAIYSLLYYTMPDYWYAFGYWRSLDGRSTDSLWFDPLSTLCVFNFIRPDKYLIFGPICIVCSCLLLLLFHPLNFVCNSCQASNVRQGNLAPLDQR